MTEEGIGRIILTEISQTRVVPLHLTPRRPMSSLKDENVVG